ncbi:hypothetical protein [Novosphingobium aquimarinum]|uniref:hypothetical protein n=1 Tax=Novosphingobium aquimarinum TaxID=2682494 RepID=UPI0018DB0F0E|nr:hypothetical protein [Novosphingobium aquimarinum]
MARFGEGNSKSFRFDLSIIVIERRRPLRLIDKPMAEFMPHEEFVEKHVIEPLRRLARQIRRRPLAENPSQVSAETLLLGQHRFSAKLLVLVAILIGLTFAIVQQW